MRSQTENPFRSDGGRTNSQENSFRSLPFSQIEICQGDMENSNNPSHEQAVADTFGITFKGIQYKVVEERYVHNFLQVIDKKYCIIKSQPGTGKTYAFNIIISAM